MTAAAVSLCAAVTVLATGCRGGASADKAGGTTGPVVLRMANGYADLSYEPAIAYFVRRTTLLSHGSLRIRVVSDWGTKNGTQPRGFEQRVVRDVAAGKADLGWVGTRVFDTLGDRSFQALTAPMLIHSYPLERAVIRSPLPRQMLASLGPLGVSGLAVLADALRKPIAVRRPLLAPSDWHGLTFATIRSSGQADAIRALGAQPTDIWGADLNDALSKGTVDGFEKNLLVYEINGTESVAPYVTANVNLWPQTGALVANPAALAALTAQQRAWMRRAADDAAIRSTALADVDAHAAAVACANGAHFAYASDADLAALRRAFAPVYARLERDRDTRAFIAAIRRLDNATPAGQPLVVPSRCLARLGMPSGFQAIPHGGDPSVLDGVYRISWTEKELLRLGVATRYVHSSCPGRCVITLTLRDGTMTMRWQPPPSCRGIYSVSGDILSMTFIGYCNGRDTAHWSLRNGELRLTRLRSPDVGDSILFGTKSWSKIG